MQALNTSTYSFLNLNISDLFSKKNSDYFIISSSSIHKV